MYPSLFVSIAMTNDTFLLDIRNLVICLEASNKKEQQLQTQLDTVQHEYQDKCSKLELELFDMEKRMAVVTDKLEQCMIAYTHNQST